MEILKNPDTFLNECDKNMVLSLQILLTESGLRNVKISLAFIRRLDVPFQGSIPGRNTSLPLTTRQKNILVKRQIKTGRSTME